MSHALTRVRNAESLRERQRENNRAVAEILAEWVRPTYLGHFSNEDRWRIQTTYWRNILGLDKGLIDSLFPLLANAPGHIGTNEMIVRVRQCLLDLKDPDIKWSDLNNWPPVAG